MRRINSSTFLVTLTIAVLTLKNSHLQAVESARNLQKFTKKTIDYNVFEHVLKSEYATTIASLVDIIITDVPYGELVSWSSENEDAMNNNIGNMMDNLIENLADNGILVISSDKKQIRIINALKKFKSESEE